MRPLGCALGLALVIAGPAACALDPCRAGTVLLSYVLPGGAESADHVDVTLTIGSGAPRTLSAARKSSGPSGSIEVDFGTYPVGQRLRFTLTARAGGRAVAEATQTLDAQPGCTSLAFSLVASQSPDLSASTDLASTDMTCGLKCQVVTCEAGTTTVSGTVYTPAATDAVYDALVFVPDGAPPSLPSGARCGCAHAGNAIAATTSNSVGGFVLSGVPAGDNIPLVIQTGYWRRQITIPHVAPCMDNPLPPDQTRLPRDHTEGELPSTAVVSGDLDALECVLRKMGVADSEFTSSNGGGRVHIYAGNGATVAGASVASNLLDNSGVLGQYAYVLVDCQGAESHTATQGMKMLGYLNGGGRTLATHYNYDLFHTTAPFSTLVPWMVNQTTRPPDPVTADINTTNPVGNAMSLWLLLVGATTVANHFPINKANYDITTTGPTTGATVWATTTTPGTIQAFSAATPVGAAPGAACGQMTFLDFHVVPTASTAGKIFPAECDGTSLTAQERLVEYFLLGMASTCLGP